MLVEKRGHPGPPEHRVGRQQAASFTPALPSSLCCPCYGSQQGFRVAGERAG